MARWLDSRISWIAGLSGDATRQNYELHVTSTDIHTTLKVQPPFVYIGTLCTYVGMYLRTYLCM